MRFGDRVEMSPGGAGAEVDDNDAVAALRGGVGDVGNAAGGGSEGGPKIETDVVQVLRVG